MLIPTPFPNPYKDVVIKKYSFFLCKLVVRFNFLNAYIHFYSHGYNLFGDILFEFNEHVVSSYPCVGNVTTLQIPIVYGPR